MDDVTKVKIAKISRNLYAYAIILAIGVLWNMVDGEVENVRDFVRGIVRSAVMFYLAKTIWDLKKVSWWVIVIASCVFSVFGIVAMMIGFVGGIALENKQLIIIGMIVLPSLILLARTFFLAVQKDVKASFIN